MLHPGYVISKTDAIGSTVCLLIGASCRQAISNHEGGRIALMTCIYSRDTMATTASAWLRCLIEAMMRVLTQVTCHLAPRFAYHTPRSSNGQARS